MACCAQDLKETMKKLLLAFYSANRHHKPERLIFYRDGVSEGQARLRPCWPKEALQGALKKLVLAICHYSLVRGCC